MTDILDLIDNATEQRCACGCRAPLDTDGPSAWFASQECQRRWGDAQATDPQDVYDRPDAEHELTGRRACGHLRCAGLPYCRESPGLEHLREVAERIVAERNEATARLGVALQDAAAQMARSLDPVFARLKDAFASIVPLLHEQGGQRGVVRRMHSMYSRRLRTRRRRGR